MTHAQVLWCLSWSMALPHFDASFHYRKQCGSTNCSYGSFYLDTMLLLVGHILHQLNVALLSVFHKVVVSSHEVRHFGSYRVAIQ